MEVTELRVHGVSGTPPEVLVGATTVEQVAGDDLVRFVRPSPAPPRRGDDPVVEGMSWGRLTSGPAVQAVWLLLLPLGLVNLAFWAGENPARERFHALVRLLALTVTAVLTVSVTHMAVDLLAWQCRGQQCGSVAGVVGFADGWSAGRRVVLAAMVPVLALAVLTAVSRRVSLRYEAVGSRGPVDTDDDVRHPLLDSPWMWRGEALGRRLRAVHLATGWAVVAAVLALVPGRPGALGVAALVLAAVVVLVGGALVALPLPWTTWSVGSLRGEGPAAAGLQAGGLGAVVLAAVAAWDGGRTWSGTTLPGLPLVVDLLVAVQTVLLLLLFAALLTRPAPDDAADDRAGREGLLRRALGRVGPGLLAGSGVLLGYAYSAAASARVADLLRGTSGEVRLTGLRVFDWGAVGFVAFVVLVVLSAVLIGVRVARGRRRLITEILAEYRPAGAPRTLTAAQYRAWRNDHRVRRIALPRAVSELVQVGNILAFLAAGTLAGLVVAAFASASTVASLVGRTLLVEPPGVLVSLGSWVVTAAGAGLVALAVAGWRSEVWRRRLGIAWDVVAFWPRAAHPLAPPSYCERAVPQLVARTRYLARDGSSPHAVVLSGHSQGSVICAAVVQQLWSVDQQHGLDRVGLLTHGSPLGRAYEAVFPHHFGGARLRVLDERLGRRWLNLVRATDPIGSSLRRVLGADRDREVADPEGLEMDEELAAYPPVRGHSGYDLSPDYEDALEQLTGEVTGRVRPTL